MIGFLSGDEIGLVRTLPLECKKQNYVHIGETIIVLAGGSLHKIDEV